MRDVYGDSQHRTTINLMPAPLMGEKAWMVTGVEVHRKFRGEGWASRLMKLVCQEADQEGVMLVLAVEPDGTGLGEKELAEWYQRLGFAREESLGRNGMYRWPQEVA